MNRRSIFAILLVALTILAIPDEPAFAQRPNIILIMADDMGYESLRSNGDGAPPTPISLGELIRTKPATGILMMTARQMGSSSRVC